MKFRLMNTIVALSLLLVACGGDDDGSPTSGGDDGIDPITAAYTATITTQFTEENFPEDYPSNASFGTIVAIVHEPEVSVYELGQIASEGFKAYIDMNDVEALSSFLVGDMVDDDAESRFTIQSQGSIDATDTTTFGLTFTPTRTRLTILANISPSPDWFVGINSFDITDGNNLIENEVIGLRALDGGTNAATTYEAEAIVENSAVKVIDSPPLVPAGLSLSLGELVITRDN